MFEYKKAQNVLCFDDILLVPQRSSVSSRRDVDLAMKLDGRRSLSLPVISSPMDTITEYEMATQMGHAGGLGIVHRYMSIAVQETEVRAASRFLVGAAVGATGDYMERAFEMVYAGAKVILVDTANGHGQMAIDAVKNLRSRFSDSIHIMAGNVSTSEGYQVLADAGADSIRVGIGGGSCCTTRLVSGHGLPTLASILEIRVTRDWFSHQGRNAPKIIADGGIRNTGDMVKAFAAGADAVMLGSMLAGTDETPGAVTNGTKSFRGMASGAAQRDWRGIATGEEGIATTVPSRGPVSEVLDSIRLGLGSGCSYSGVDKLVDLQEAALYARVSNASLNESRPHA